MGAVPKHKTTTKRQGKRRSQLKLAKRRYTSCTNCGAPVLSHQACSACGHYK